MLRAHEDLSTLQVESDIRRGWNTLTVWKTYINSTSEIQAAFEVSKAYFVAVSDSALARRHHGDILSACVFSTMSKSPLPSLMPLDAAGIFHFGPEFFRDKSDSLRAVFEALFRLGNRTIISFGDSVERNIANEIYSICKEFSGIFKCSKMPNLAEPGRAVHVAWPSIGLNWITISFPGVSFIASRLSSFIIKSAITSSCLLSAAVNSMVSARLQF